MAWGVGSFSAEDRRASQRKAVAERRRAREEQEWESALATSGLTGDEKQKERTRRRSPGIARAMDRSEQRAAADAARRDAETQKEQDERDRLAAKWDEQRRVREGAEAEAQRYLEMAESGAYEMDVDDPDLQDDAVRGGATSVGGAYKDPSADDGREGYRLVRPRVEGESGAEADAVYDRGADPNDAGGEAGQVYFDGDERKWQKEDRSKTTSARTVRMRTMGKDGERWVQKAIELGAKHGFVIVPPKGYAGAEEFANMERRAKVMKEEKKKKADEEKRLKGISDGWTVAEQEAEEMGLGHRLPGLRALHAEKPDAARAEMKKDFLMAMGKDEKKVAAFEKKMEKVDGEYEKLMAQTAELDVKLKAQPETEDDKMGGKKKGKGRIAAEVAMQVHQLKLKEVQRRREKLYETYWQLQQMKQRANPYAPKGEDGDAVGWGGVGSGPRAPAPQPEGEPPMEQDELDVIAEAWKAEQGGS